jgi:hypothetical protein
MHRSGLAVAFAAAGALTLLAAPSGPTGPAAPPRLLLRPSELEFTATVHSRSFERGVYMPRYHAIVWSGGRAAGHALLRADVTDVEVLEALERLGARPGDNLPMEAWEKRRDPHHTEPDRIIAGSAIEILLRLPGRTGLVPLADVLEDPGGRGVRMRFGGNRENVPKWKSGCIVCLYSCPGSKVGNARYTVRDYVRGTTRFGVRKGVLPPDGTPIAVIFRVTKERSATGNGEKG